jgi:TPR repeat protein
VDLRWLEKVAKKGGKEGDGGGGRGGGGSNAAAVEARRLYVEIFLARQGGAAQGVRARAAQTGEGVQQESEEEEGEGALVVSVQEKRRQEMVATNMLKLLADSGDAQSKFHYGSFLLSDTARLHKDEDAAQGLDMVEEAANTGCAEAMYFMGKAHAGGKHNLPPSDLAAVEWLARAAEAGHAAAQFKLGMFYQHGRGVAKDAFMASEWFYEAAEQGDANAQFALGVACGKGLGVEKNHEQACYWYSKAAHQGHGKAQFNLALRYTEGLGCIKDPYRGAYWFAQAAHNRVFGRGARIKKGVVQGAAQRELRQPMSDTPSAKHVQESVEPKRLVKLSEFNAIRWNRNPKDYRDGSPLDLATLVRAEGKKVPRCVIIDDPQAADFGKIYFTRPAVEAKERCISKLLLAHGLDWKSMQLDYRLNHFNWAKTELRRRARKLLAKRMKAPREMLFRHEVRVLPRMRALERQIERNKREKQLALLHAQQWIAAIEDRNRSPDASLRALQLGQSSEVLSAWLTSAGVDGAGANGHKLLGAADESWLDGSEVTVGGVKVIMGLDLQQHAVPGLQDGSDAASSTQRLTEGEFAGGYAAVEEGARKQGEGQGVTGGGGFPEGADGHSDRSLVSADHLAAAAHADRDSLSTTSQQPSLFLSPLALPLPGMLGSTELDVNDRQALVNAAARSGVAVEMVGPKVRVCVCVSVRAWACLCVEMPVFVAAHTV